VNAAKDFFWLINTTYVRIQLLQSLCITTNFYLMNRHLFDTSLESESVSIVTSGKVSLSFTLLSLIVFR
jgi:hypothetical protein